MAARKKTKSGASKKSTSIKSTSQASSVKAQRPIPLDAQTLIIVALLVFAYPLGVTLMFLWTRWPFWVKMVIAIPLALFFIMVGLPILAVLILLHKLTDYDQARYLITDGPTPSPVVMTASPSATMMTPTPGATMKYGR